jgi:hypothetical protein
VRRKRDNAWFLVTAALTLSTSACRSKTWTFEEPDAKRLDATQLASARRVALESAAEAMDRRDLERLKMLSRWVRERAQVVLFEESDLTALDLAIGCLDRSVASAKALAELDELESGTLVLPARGVCSP